ncbi:MAG: AMP-binding protein [Nocardia sp.]|uniref:acyl-CoA synthetase n=1 Tax=Nocardia sp. TaxID=1821 RepID=UPI002626A975|nr:acyl-CoA synthetase [Nocardia sp.]MCU1639987.1 AMP-binding protein [Nocardia sp.]
MTEQLSPPAIDDEQLLWPQSVGPHDLADIETVPLDRRGLPESTYALLVRAATRWPDRTAVTVLPDAARWREPLQRSYSQLLADVHRYANLLHAKGVGRSDAVALIGPNCAELIGATLAAQLAGIAAPINGALAPLHIGELLRRSGARVLISAGPELSAPLWETTRSLAAAGAVDTILVLRPTTPTDAPPALPVIDGVDIGYLDERAGDHDPHTFAGVAPAATDLAALFHTGGTTGVPKLAAHTHANEVANAWMLAANELLDQDSVVFAALPLFHVNALVVTLLSPLFKGQPVVWAGSLGYRDPALFAVFWKMVERYGIAVMSAVPTVYAVLSQFPVDADITCLRYAAVGASPLPPAVGAVFHAHTGVTLVEGYGLTEATCASARSFPEYPRPGAVGQRMPYQRISVVCDGDWDAAGPGEIGELAISGPTVFAGYVAGRDDNGYLLDGMGALHDGWLRTGDLAHIDDEGFIHLHGRAKDLIIRGGHNIDPALIEDALLEHPDVVAAGAVGRPDVHAGEVPVAYVALAAGATVTETELLEWAGLRVPERAAIPKAVVVVDALPVTDVGKPYKLALRADATSREIHTAVDDLDGIVAVTTEIVDGTVRSTIDVTDVTAADAVTQRLGRYAIAWGLRIGAEGSQS